MIDLASFLTAFAGITCTFILLALAATRIRHAYLRIGRNYTRLSPIRRQAPRRHTRPLVDDAPIGHNGEVLYTYRITSKWINLHRN